MSCKVKLTGHLFLFRRLVTKFIKYVSYTRKKGKEDGNGQSIISGIWIWWFWWLSIWCTIFRWTFRWFFRRFDKSLPITILLSTTIPATLLSTILQTIPKTIPSKILVTIYLPSDQICLPPRS